ncbi:MAG: hypothetical protein EBS56_07530 [Planctomycetia bacterium]|nr:hypothetical protein [Planctomycetia bacterium]
MTAELRLVIAPKEARLTLRRGDDVIEDEVWKFDRKLGNSEATEIARVAFDDAYDLLQFTAHGDD